MRPTGADYMEWAKQVPRKVRYSLAQSGVRDLPREELGFDPAALEYNGAGNEYGSEELRSALAARHGRMIRRNQDS